jgi:hypothetical protein
MIEIGPFCECGCGSKLPMFNFIEIHSDIKPIFKGN